MKVFHIESGLGNQMLDYADLIASRYVNPQDSFYIETIIYDLGEKQQSISMWNGYELESVFGIKEKNIKDCFSADCWNEIIADVVKSQFWDDGWTYSDAITEALKKQGLNLINIHRRPHTGKKVEAIGFPFYRYLARQIYYKCFSDKSKIAMAIPKTLYRKSDSNDFDGHYLRFMYKGNQIEKIEKTLRSVFTFPKYDSRNENFSVKLKNCNSVAIHARRGDFLGLNSYCYKYGYFKRAVHFIKKNVESPVFVFFCDPGSVSWCRENANVFGLDFDIDDVLFVDWNHGTDSFRDMQLMTDCKHNIITNSSFGWWGAFLNNNPQKITCSPDPRINTTNWF